MPQLPPGLPQQQQQASSGSSASSASQQLGPIGSSLISQSVNISGGPPPGVLMPSMPFSSVSLIQVQAISQFEFQLQVNLRQICNYLKWSTVLAIVLGWLINEALSTNSKNNQYQVLITNSVVKPSSIKFENKLTGECWQPKQPIILD